MAFRDFKKLQYGFFIFVAILIVLLSLISILQTRQFVDEAFSAMGTVVAASQGGSRLTIKFTAIDDGGEIREIEYIQTGLIYGYKIGDQLEVLYEAQNPQKACIRKFGALYGLQTLGMILGLFFVAIFSWKFLKVNRLEDKS